MHADELNSAIESAQEKRLPTSITASRWSKCDRKMWLTLRGAVQPAHPAERLRTFRIGHALEDAMVEWIEAAGYKVAMREAELKNKWGVVLARIDGILAKDGEFYLLEMKTANNRRFNEMMKKGIPDTYFAQVQLEMHHSAQLSARGNQLTKCVFVIINKDNSEIHTEVVEYDKVYAELQTERVHDIIASDAYPAPDRDWTCKMCDQRKVCEGEYLPEINCRTCAFVSVEDGVFTCPFGDEPCEKHIFHPQIMEDIGYPIVSVDNANMAVEYERFVMASPGHKHDTKPTFNSWDMRTLVDSGLQDDEQYLSIAKEFNAKPVNDDGEVPF